MVPINLKGLFYPLDLFLYSFMLIFQLIKNMTYPSPLSLFLFSFVLKKTHTHTQEYTTLSCHRHHRLSPSPLIATVVHHHLPPTITIRRPPIHLIFPPPRSPSLHLPENSYFPPRISLAGKTCSDRIKGCSNPNWITHQISFPGGWRAKWTGSIETTT